MIDHMPLHSRQVKVAHEPVPVHCLCGARHEAEVCLVCAGESGQKEAARRRHLLQAPDTPLQLPLTGTGKVLH